MKNLPIYRTILALSSASILTFVMLNVTSCGSYSPKATAEARNTRSPREIVQEHLRAAEAGDFTKANGYLAEDYAMKMQGMPFFISIKKVNALDMHKARKIAFPDFRFNEKIEWEKDNQVKIAVYLSGTHSGVLDYPSSVGVPRTEPTNKTIALPAEYFIYSVENDKIIRTDGEIPEGNGPPALMKQLGIEKK
jgi:hypothetical protein